MQKIMFDDKFGLTKAVIEGRKTMTRRTVKLPLIAGLDEIEMAEMETDWKCNYKAVFYAYDMEGKRKVCEVKPRYQVGEEVAVAQSYLDIKGSKKLYSPEDWREIETRHNKPMHDIKGVDNKMYVRADLMPHRIKITNIKLERMQDISDEDCRKEGIIYVQWRQYPEPFSDRYVDHDLWTLPKYEQQFTDAWSDDDPDAWAAESPKTAFAVLIRKMCGKKSWDSNPWVWVYEFSLIK